MCRLGFLPQLWHDEVMISLLLASSAADNPGIPEPIAIIIGAVIAAVSGFGAVFAQNKFQRIAERKSLAAALLGEIKAVRLTAYLQRYDDMLVTRTICIVRIGTTNGRGYSWRSPSVAWSTTLRRSCSRPSWIGGKGILRRRSSGLTS